MADTFQTSDMKDVEKNVNDIQQEEVMNALDAFDEDPLEDLGIEFLLEEVENKIAPLALA